MRRHRNEPENSRENGRYVFYSCCGDAVAVFHASTSQLRLPFSGNDDYLLRDSHLCAVLMKFLQYLGAVRPFEAISLALEVSPGNTRARRVYEAMGFRPGRIQLSPPRW
jgi:hypothetical protein